MITKKDLRWTALAKKMLKINQHPKYALVSIVVRGGNLISVGTNKESAAKRFYKHHRPEMKLHAEVDSILGLSKDTTKGSTVYVVGTTKAGNLMTCRPCETCMNVLKYMGIKRIVYQDLEELKEC